MKKILSASILTATMILGACSQTEEETNNSDVLEEDLMSEVTDSEMADEAVDSDVLFLANQNEQLGGESFSEEGLSKRTQIVDKDGYTYVLTPSMETQSKSGTLIVSILKDDEFIIKEKVIDIEMPSIEGDRYRYTEMAFYGNTLLIVSADNTKYKSPTQYIFTTVTVNENGEAETNEVRRSEYDDKYLEDALISGLKGYYFFEQLSDNNANIVDKDGNVLYSFSTDGKYPVDTDVAFLDEENDRIYFYGSEGKIAFDLNENDMIWDTSGTEMIFDFPAGYRTTRLAGNNGMYILEQLSLTDSTLTYYTFISEGELAFVSEGLMGSALEAVYEYNDILSLDDENLNVYKIVMYKGDPTIQKFSFARVD